MSMNLEFDEIIDVEDGSEDCGPSIHEICRFLSEYAVELFGSGSTCIRLEKNLRRIARSLDAEVEFSVLPRHLHITVSSHGEEVTSVVAIRQLPISYARITDLSRLSWQMADGKLGFEKARALLPKIFKSRQVNRWTLVILVAIANASFCRLFQGDWVAMVSVFTATFTGFLLKLALQQKQWDARIMVFLCAFVSSVIAGICGRLGIGGTPEVALATSVLYLVPGIPFINSFCDLLDRHYICAFGRCMNAVVLLCSLSLGLLCAMTMLGLGMFSYLR